MNSELLWGAVPQIMEDSLEIDDGDLGALDEGTVDVLTAWPLYKPGLTALGLQKNELVTNSEIPGEFWVQRYRIRREGSALAVVTVSIVGFLSDAIENRTLREISAFGQSISIGPIEKTIIEISPGEGIDPATGDPVEVRRRVPKLDANGDVEYVTIVTPSGAAERWNINDPTVSLTDTYFAKTEPDTAEIGTGMDPPFAPNVPPYQWIGYNEPLRSNHPGGWFLSDRKISIIIPGKLWKVVDTYDYVQAAQPD